MAITRQILMINLNDKQTISMLKLTLQGHAQE